MFRYHDLIDRLDGYTIGTLIVLDDEVYIETKDGKLYAEQFEVLNGDTYESYSVEQALAMRDSAGWPIMAGCYARARV